MTWSRWEGDEGGASAPTHHPPNPRPYIGFRCGGKVGALAPPRTVLVGVLTEALCAFEGAFYTVDAARVEGGAMGAFQSADAAISAFDLARAPATDDVGLDFGDAGTQPGADGGGAEFVLGRS